MALTRRHKRIRVINPKSRKTRNAIHQCVTVCKPVWHFFSSFPHTVNNFNFL